jgi:hypothetical protein
MAVVWCDACGGYLCAGDMPFEQAQALAERHWQGTFQTTIVDPD